MKQINEELKQINEKIEKAMREAGTSLAFLLSWNFTKEQKDRAEKILLAALERLKEL